LAAGWATGESMDLSKDQENDNIGQWRELAAV
jgi:hypothetical protein